MAIYYIDSINGSNSNSGTSADSALQSLDMVAGLKLKAGDSVLLARGSVFTDTLVISKSGDVGNPITIGAYGEGDNPKLSGSMGIHGSKASNIVVKDLTIADTLQTAIYGGSAANWVIDNVSLSNTGTLSGIGSIVFKNSDNITVSNSKFDHVSSDAIFLMGIDGVTLTNNQMTNIRGHTADGIQVNDSSNVVISGNDIDLSTTADSTKGGVMVQNSTNVVVDDNEVLGGSFGIVVNGWNVTITDNILSGQDKYSWSSSIMIGGNMNLYDYTITGNVISNSNFGVSLTGLQADEVTRTDIEIADNIFTDMIKTALKIDKVSSGSFHDNIIVDSVMSFIRNPDQAVSFTVSDNQTLTAEEYAALPTTPPVVAPDQGMPEPTTPDMPAAPEHAGEIGPPPPPPPPPPSPPPPAPSPAPGAHLDKYSVAADGETLTGNILLNDLRTTGEVMSLRTVGSSRIGSEGLDINGLYGMLHIEADGDFSYTLYSNALSSLHNATSALDKFQYKAADGKVIDTSKIIIDLSDYLHAHDDVVV
jgi:polysaccharidase protein